MWAAIIKYLYQPLLTYLILPLTQGLLAKLILFIKEKWDKKQKLDKIEETTELDKKKYEEAKTPKEQENAFEDSLHNSRSPK